MKSVCLFFLLSLFLIGCHPPASTLQEMPASNPHNKYKMEDVAGRVVLILPPSPNTIFIRNPEDMMDNLPHGKEDVNTILVNAIYRTFTKSLGPLKDNGNKPLFATDSTLTIIPGDTTSTFSLKLAVGPDSIPYTYFLPKKEWLAAKGIAPDILLVISSIEYGRNITSEYNEATYVPGSIISTPTGVVTTPGMMMGGGTYTSSQINGIYHYLIYDYLHKSWITHGVQEVSTAVPIGGLRQKVLENTFVEAIEKMFALSPWEEIVNHTLQQRR